ncbi:RTA1 like [Fusarium pseudoanthophilum]|uniref:RTA1 like n=1 Tax=Fusarium pseudoanthophilum TaxID=48495 RepID=A0A8H5KLE6_9HYPO|nr:RTA1 like [Fusarium pseudoanthophilum]
MSYYHYNPSLAAAVIFIILFTATTILHFFQMIQTRTWFFLAFSLGGICPAVEVIGYIGRTVPDTLGAYIVQSIFLLVAPALFAASIYMELGRIVDLVGGDRYLYVPRRWLTRIFVIGDVLSFFMQGAGGGMMGSDNNNSRNLGEKLIVVGLFVQIVFFGCFVITAAIFHLRLRRNPTQKVIADKPPYVRHLMALYITSILIFIRSLVRVIEFIQGFDGYIISHEIFIYLFDAVPMLAVTLIMNWVHPSEIKKLLVGGRMAKGFTIVEPSGRRKASASDVELVG